jgi:ribonuclease HI
MTFNKAAKGPQGKEKSAGKVFPCTKSGMIAVTSQEAAEKVKNVISNSPDNVYNLMKIFSQVNGHALLEILQQNLPAGLKYVHSHSFDDNTTGSGQEQEVAVIGFSLYAPTGNKLKDLVPCNGNWPSVNFSAGLSHYGIEFIHAPKDESTRAVNHLSLRKLNENVPGLIHACSFAANAGKNQYVPMLATSCLDSKHWKKNFQVVLDNFSNSLLMTDKRKPTGKVVEYRARVINEIFNSLKGCLASRKRELFIAVVVFDPEFICLKSQDRNELDYDCFSSSAEHVRVYPHKIHIFHVADLVTELDNGIVNSVETKFHSMNSSGKGSLFGVLDVHHWLGQKDLIKPGPFKCPPGATYKVVRTEAPVKETAEDTSQVPATSMVVTPKVVAANLAANEVVDKPAEVVPTKVVSAEVVDEPTKVVVAERVPADPLQKLGPKEYETPVQDLPSLIGFMSKTCEFTGDSPYRSKHLDDSKVAYVDASTTLAQRVFERIFKYASEYIRVGDKAIVRSISQFMWQHEHVIDVLDYFKEEWETFNDDDCPVSYVASEDKIEISFFNQYNFTIVGEHAFDCNGCKFEAGIDYVEVGTTSTINVSSSIGRFMLFFYAYVLMYVKAANMNRENMAANVSKLLTTGKQLWPTTPDAILNANPAFKNLQSCALKLGIGIDMADVTPGYFHQNKNYSGKALAVEVVAFMLSHGVRKLLPERTTAAKASSSWLKGLKLLNAQDIVDITRLALNMYPKLGSLFNKPGVLFQDVFHLAVDAKVSEVYSLSKELKDYGLVVLSTKVSKASKRVAMIFANAVKGSVHGNKPVDVGYVHLVNGKRMPPDSGPVLTAVILPTAVFPAGVALMLNKDKYLEGRFTSSQDFIFEGYQDIQDAVVLTELTKSHSPTKGTQSYEFTSKPKIAFGEVLFNVVNQNGMRNPGMLRVRDSVNLLSISWGKQTNLAKGSESLKVTVVYEQVHTGTFKLRGDIKCMLQDAKSVVIRNDLNKSLGLGDLQKADTVYFKDVIKQDVLWYWLTIVGNTIEHGDPSHLHVSQLRSLKAKVHEVLGVNPELPLHICNKHVVTGTYSELLQYFCDNFKQAAWVYTPEAGTFGQMLFDLHKVKSDWVNVARADYPAELVESGPNLFEGFVRNNKTLTKYLNSGVISQAQYESLLSINSYSWHVMTDGVVSNPESSVLAFLVLNQDLASGIPASLEGQFTVPIVLQRTMGFVGAKGKDINGKPVFSPVYSVPLLERTTVQEAVSLSRGLPQVMRFVNKLASKDNLNFFSECEFPEEFKSQDAAEQSFLADYYRNQVIAEINLAMYKGNTLGLTVIDIQQYGFSVAEQVQRWLDSFASTLQVEVGDCVTSELYQVLAEQFKDVVFRFAGCTFWLPGLYVTNSLANSAVSTESVSYQFMNAVLLPCLLVRKYQALGDTEKLAQVGNLGLTAKEAQVFGKMQSFALSGARKLLTSGQNVTAKRLANPLVPASEMWVVKSNHPGSVYQLLVKAGLIDRSCDYELGAVNGSNGYVVIGSRAPISFGAPLRLVVLDRKDNEKLFYPVDQFTIAISPVSVYVDFGDCDGDGYYASKLGQVPSTKYADYITTYSRVIKHLERCLGNNPFKVYSDYIGDHLSLAKWSKTTAMVVGLGKTISSKAIVSKDNHIKQSINALSLQTIAVGASYNIYQWTDHAVDIIRGLGSVLRANKVPMVYEDAAAKFGADSLLTKIVAFLEVFGCLADETMILLTSVIYEVFLGGYSDESWNVYTQVVQKLQKPSNGLVGHLLSGGGGYLEKVGEQTNWLPNLTCKTIEGSVEKDTRLHQMIDAIHKLGVNSKHPNFHIALLFASLCQLYKEASNKKATFNLDSYYHYDESQQAKFHAVEDILAMVIGVVDVAFEATRGGALADHTRPAPSSRSGEYEDFTDMDAGFNEYWYDPSDCSFEFDDDGFSGEGRNVPCDRLKHTKEFLQLQDTVSELKDLSKYSMIVLQLNSLRDQFGWMLWKDVECSVPRSHVNLILNKLNMSTEITDMTQQQQQEVITSVCNTTAGVVETSGDLKRQPFKLKTAVVETPVVETPVVETPVVKTPEVETPEVKTPEVETPVVKTPEVKTPKVEASVVQTPVVETPKVKRGVNVARREPGADMANLVEQYSSYTSKTHEMTLKASQLMAEAAAKVQAEISRLNMEYQAEYNKLMLDVARGNSNSLLEDVLKLDMNHNIKVAELMAKIPLVMAEVTTAVQLEVSKLRTESSQLLLKVIGNGSPAPQLDEPEGNDNGGSPTPTPPVKPNNGNDGGSEVSPNNLVAPVQDVSTVAQVPTQPAVTPVASQPAPKAVVPQPDPKAENPVAPVTPVTSEPAAKTLSIYVGVYAVGEGSQGCKKSTFGSIAVKADGTVQDLLQKSQGLLSNAQRQCNAIVSTLSAIKDFGDNKVIVYVNSKTVVDAITRNYPKLWKSNGWKTKDGKPVKFAESYKLVLSQLERANNASLEFVDDPDFYLTEALKLARGIAPNPDNMAPRVVPDAVTENPDPTSTWLRLEEGNNSWGDGDNCWGDGDNSWGDGDNSWGDGDEEDSASTLLDLERGIIYDPTDDDEDDLSWVQDGRKAEGLPESLLKRIAANPNANMLFEIKPTTGEQDPTDTWRGPINHEDFNGDCGDEGNNGDNGGDDDGGSPAPRGYFPTPTPKSPSGASTPEPKSQTATEPPNVARPVAVARQLSADEAKFSESALGYLIEGSPMSVDADNKLFALIDSIRVQPKNPSLDSEAKVAKAKADAYEAVKVLNQEQRYFVSMFLVGASSSSYRVENNPQPLALQAANRVVPSNANFILNGEAGTGKSFTVSCLIKVAALLGYKVVVTGPTGISVVNLPPRGERMRGTFNQVFGLSDGFNSDSDDRTKELVDFEKLIKKSRKATLKAVNEDGYLGVIVVVDEYSMLGGALAQVVLNQVEEACLTAPVRRKRPVQWLFVGDPQQLPPVKDVRVTEKTTFIGEGESVVYPDVLSQLKMKCFKLRKQNRQSDDPSFSKELTELAAGSADISNRNSNVPEIVKRIREAANIPMPDDALRIMHSTLGCREYNNTKLKKVSQETNNPIVTLRADAGVYNRYKEYGFDTVDKLFTGTRAVKTLELCIGAVVRVNCNVYKAEDTYAANGQRGIVKGFLWDRDVISAVKVDLYDEKGIPSIDKTFGLFEYNVPLIDGAPVGFLKQFPLELSWASTVHSCQGLTLNRIVLEYNCPSRNGRSKALQFLPNGLYVALSRLRGLSGLFINSNQETRDLSSEDKLDQKAIGDQAVRDIASVYNHDGNASKWLTSQYYEQDVLLYKMIRANVL